MARRSRTRSRSSSRRVGRVARSRRVSTRRRTSSARGRRSNTVRIVVEQAQPSLPRSAGPLNTIAAPEPRRAVL